MKYLEEEDLRQQRPYEEVYEHKETEKYCRQQSCFEQRVQERVREEEEDALLPVSTCATRAERLRIP